VAGRFTSLDPKGFDGANELSFGRYTYANDSPYKYIDPDGKWSLFIREEGANNAVAQSYNDSVRSTFGGAADAISDISRKYLIALGTVATLEGGVPVRFALKQILEPNGSAVGIQWRGAGDEIRTVSPGKWDEMLSALKDLGATSKDKAGYKGEWFELPQGAGEFGVRDSDRSGPTLDLNIPGSKIEKIHQSGHE
jgi:hypothetical protein